MKVMFLHLPKRHRLGGHVVRYSTTVVPMGLFGLANLLEAKGHCAEIVHRGIEEILDPRFDLVGFLASPPRMRNILISNVALEGNGLRNFSEIVVRLEELAHRVRDAARLYESKGIGLKVFGVPLCALGDDRAHSNDLFWDRRVTVERGRPGGDIGLAAVEGYHPTRDRIRSRDCNGCCFRSDTLCGGVFQRYAAEYGLSEIRPVRRESCSPDSRGEKGR